MHESYYAVSRTCQRCCVSCSLSTLVTVCLSVDGSVFTYRRGEERSWTSQLLLGWIVLHVTCHQWLFAEISLNNLAHEGSHGSLSSPLAHNNLIIFCLTPHPCAVRVLVHKQTLKVLIQEENRLPTFMPI